MLPLLKINLLPYREVLLAKQKKQFQTLILFAALIGIGLSVLIYLGMQTLVLNQQNRNQTLTDGINEADVKISKIKELNTERKNFLARKHKVEELSNKRFEAARILDTLNTLVPEGLYITSLEAQGSRGNIYVINGQAISDNKTAMLMSALPGKIFNTPELLNIKRDTDAQQFSLRVSLNTTSINNPVQESADNTESENSNAQQASDEQEETNDAQEASSASAAND